MCGGEKRGGAVDRAGLREVRDTKNILLKNYELPDICILCEIK